MTPDALRVFLRDRMSPERLRRVASADYDCDGDGIAQEFARNLELGVYAYAGHGNPYECALMQRYDETADRPLNELFGAWWIGAFCSDPENFVLIHNLAARGVDSLLHMVVRGCGQLGVDAPEAAGAAIPFVRCLQSRAPFPDEASFKEAIAALQEIEGSAATGTKNGRYAAFLAKVGEPDDV